MIIVFLVLVIAVMIVERLGWCLKKRNRRPSRAATREPVKQQPGESRPSIAVLPFVNRSRAEDDAFFVDGVHDDLLTQLARISALKVISRTSVMSYRDTEKPIPLIGQELGVATVMEGSVQRAGDRIRINVQLIDAATDEHLWAEIYDRELTAPISSKSKANRHGHCRCPTGGADPGEARASRNRPTETWQRLKPSCRPQRLARRTTSSIAEATNYFRQRSTIGLAIALARGLADTLSSCRVDYSGTGRDGGGRPRPSRWWKALPNSMTSSARLQLARQYSQLPRYDAATTIIGVH